jgi:hypothetical protein
VNAVCCCSGKVNFNLCNINANEKNCNFIEFFFVAMQMHLSIEEEGKKRKLTAKKSVSLAAAPK